MTQTGSWHLAGVLGALASVATAACGGTVDPAGPSDASTPMGSINAEFQLPSGSASTASYTLTGPGGFSQASMLDFQGSQAVGFFIGSVPAGSGYTLTFTAADEDGGESCKASTSVEVTPDKTAMVSLLASCIGGPYVPTGYGTIDTWVSWPAGIALAQAQCTLTGPAGEEVTGDAGALTVEGSSGLHFDLKQVPAGTGQVLSIGAKATNGAQCAAAVTVDVVANETVESVLPLLCR